MKVAYLINSTPKYFYLLPLHLGLIKRYCPLIPFDIFLATEVPDHPIVTKLVEAEGLRIVTIRTEESGFLASRAAALRELPAEYDLVIPMQEDFLLERIPDFEFILESFEHMKQDPRIQSIRWMPCPGPSEKDELYDANNPHWKVLDSAHDTYLFCFQATLWDRKACQTWYSKLVEQFAVDYPATLSDEERRVAEIRANYAENTRGQGYFKEWMMGPDKIHLAWVRKHRWPNAVYMSPWPYRPTAVVGGRLEAWAIELGKREGWQLTGQQ
jgi:hypothetical protein